MSQSPAYSPLDTLVDLACRDGVEIRPTLLRVLTDLFVQKPRHSAEEEAQYIELALRLIEAVDASTRKIVAATLSSYANAPTAVLRRLLELAGASSSAVAQPATAASGQKPSLADEFFAASADERRLILTTIDATRTISQPARRSALAGGSEVIRRLEIAALQRNPGEFARILERALEIDRAVAERIIRDNSGESLLVVAKVLGTPTSIVERILLFVNPIVGQSVKRVFDLSRLYEEIEPAAAEQMLAIWREASSPRRAVHAPVYSDERPVRGRAVPAPERQAANRPAAQRPLGKLGSG